MGAFNLVLLSLALVPCGKWRGCGASVVKRVFTGEGGVLLSKEAGGKSSSEITPAEFELNNSGLTRLLCPFLKWIKREMPVMH